MGCDIVVHLAFCIFHNFNLRTRMGCDYEPRSWRVSVSLFQSTHPHGVRPLSAWRRHCLLPYFNPRTRMGCDIICCFALVSPQISIHAPAWGATLKLDAVTPAHVFQSTHPHGVRLLYCYGNCGDLAISIHAPAWGATRSSRLTGCRPYSISIHAPAWGATWRQHRGSPRRYDFNPRTRMGCDMRARHAS